MKIETKSKKTWLNSARELDMDRLKLKIANYPINEELIVFFERQLNGITQIDQKLFYLYYIKKVLPFIKRQVDERHVFAFEEEYQNDRELFDPKKWIDNELRFWNSVKVIELKMEKKGDILEARKELSKQWLTKAEMMQMFDFSVSTLNRRIAEGMPCHQKGRAVFFNLEEIGEWLKEDEVN